MNSWEGMQSLIRNQDKLVVLSENEATFKVRCSSGDRHRCLAGSTPAPGTGAQGHCCHSLHPRLRQRQDPGCRWRPCIGLSLLAGTSAALGSLLSGAEGDRLHVHEICNLHMLRFLGNQGTKYRADTSHASITGCANPPIHPACLICLSCRDLSSPAMPRECWVPVAICFIRCPQRASAASDRPVPSLCTSRSHMCEDVVCNALFLTPENTQARYDAPCQAVVQDSSFVV